MYRITHLCLLALPLLALFAPGCKKPEAPLFQGIDNLQVISAGSQESVISAGIKLYNPNNYKLQFRHGELSVSINNHFVGTTVLDTLIDIPRKDSFLIPVTMKVNMHDMLSNALDMLLQNGVAIKVDGFVRLKKAGIYIKTPIHYEGRQKIDL